MGISYKIRLFGDHDAVPLEGVIDMDKDIRKQIKAILVENYEWKN